MKLKHAMFDADLVAKPGHMSRPERDVGAAYRFAFATAVEKLVRTDERLRAKRTGKK